PELPLLQGAFAGHPVPVRGAGAGDQPAHARPRREPGRRPAQRRGQGRARLPRPAHRRHLQAGHLRPAREPRRGRRRVPAGPRCRPELLRPARRRLDGRRHRGRAGRRLPGGRRGRGPDDPAPAAPGDRPGRAGRPRPEAVRHPGQVRRSPPGGQAVTTEDTYIPGAVDSGGRRGHRKRRHLKVSYLFFIAIAAFIATRLDSDSLHLYSIGAMSLLGLKMFGALFYRPAKANREELEYLEECWVTAVIPIYNEDPVMFEQGMRSLLAQSRLPNEIHIIDDCSAHSGGIRAAKRMRPEFEALAVKYTVSVQPENKGKREALALGFEAAPYSDIFLCVDSDTVLSRDTVRELLLPLADEKIMASTGMVLALNHDSNVFTRLQDLRYGNSFLFERAAYSRLKSVLCCCGALSAYRGSLVRKYLPDFLNQQFLGKPAVFGDDRRMTNYCLMEGQVVFQETAVGYTAVPEKLPHFLRQQVRWNKSFFRESLWAFRHQKKYRPAFWLTCMELGLWLVFGTAMFYSMVILPIMQPARFLNHIGDYALFMVLMGYLRNVRYLDF